MDKKLVLMVPVIQEEVQEPSYGPSSGCSTILDNIQLPIEQIEELVKQFTNFQLDTLELHVKGAANSSGVIQLFIGMAGEAGIKIILKRKPE